MSWVLIVRIWLLSTLFWKCDSACAKFATNDAVTVTPETDVSLTFSITNSCPTDVTVSKVWVTDTSTDPTQTLCFMRHYDGACNRNYTACTCSTSPRAHAYSVAKHVHASHALVLNGELSNGEVFDKTVNIVVADLPSSTEHCTEISTEPMKTQPDVTSPLMSSFNSREASSHEQMTPSPISDDRESTVSDPMQAADELVLSSPFKISLEIIIFIVFGVVVFIIVVVLSVLVGILFKKRGRSASIPEAPPAPHRFRPSSEGLAIILRRLQEQQQPNLRLQMPENRLAVLSYADNTYAQIPESPERVEMELFESTWSISSLYKKGLVVSNDSTSSSSGDSVQPDRPSNMSDTSSVNWSDRSDPTLPQLPDDYLHPVSALTGGNSANVAVTAASYPTQETDDKQPYEIV